jgi:hypothetical protein
MDCLLRSPCTPAQLYPCVSDAKLDSSKNFELLQYPQSSHLEPGSPGALLRQLDCPSVLHYALVTDQLVRLTTTAAMLTSAA